MLCGSVRGAQTHRESTRYANDSFSARQGAKALMLPSFPFAEARFAGSSAVMEATFSGLATNLLCLPELFSSWPGCQTWFLW